MLDVIHCIESSHTCRRYCGERWQWCKKKTDNPSALTPRKGSRSLVLWRGFWDQAEEGRLLLLKEYLGELEAMEALLRRWNKSKEKSGSLFGEGERKVGGDQRHPGRLQHSTNRLLSRGEGGGSHLFPHFLKSPLEAVVRPAVITGSLDTFGNCDPSPKRHTTGVRGPVEPDHE